MAKPLVEKASERLLELILERGYEVGDKLPNEYELAQDLEVGRSTVREAVRSLATRNILEVRQGSGTYISSKKGVSEDPLGFSLVRDRVKLTTDLFEVRYLLEPRIAERVAQFASDEDIARLEDIVVAIEEAVAAGDSKHLELDVQFHCMLAEMSGNLAMTSLMPVINQSIHLINENYSNHQMKSDSLQAHRNILMAIKQRHPVAAYDSMLAHIIAVRQVVLSEWFDKDMTLHGLNDHK
ncbi:TPA: FadR family transcriptional regulator [Streptococcus suis]|nr:FadR family transcriptional regulator [Streptococcus suis]NQJ53896.1 FadR family transcriptional regulator [Streptococcus suis]HEM4387116.1 FadR family transcriptional regulator [Streptococcus suis]HEM4608625.1 FadR family transcriptional regulator [Streptococcus suis]HEM6026792.1 FadR family transcriptional regulator [Streptococcus suis]